MNTLLHVCCAPCSIMCIEALKGKGIDVTAFWYNINIHPFTEYRARRNAMAEYAKSIGLELITDDNYGLREFVTAVGGDIDNRCGFCYESRLEKTAQKAAELGYDSFTTSLLISPYQKHEAIIETGHRLGEKYNLAFLDEDFRPYFREGQARARELELYMQKYCGCIFSEEDRYAKKK